jgi:hypothetical protein
MASVNLTLAEELLYSTTKITAYRNGTAVSNSTGFFMEFPVGESGSAYVLLTNKHAVEGSTDVTVLCHIEAYGRPSGRFVTCSLAIQPNVVPHPKSDVDLCALLFTPILIQAQTSGTPLFLRALDPSLIPAEEDWEFFDSIEDVTMVGCPSGIYDEVNNLPIVRRGITASALSKKYNGKDEFMVDMACFPGSSGSPIFLYDRNGYFDRKQNTYLIGKGRIKLVGVLHSGPVVTNDGRIVFSHTPRITVNSMMHLGNALRSTEIFAIQEEFMSRRSKMISGT